MVKNKKKGFTIVELVIVIAVIGILSAVLIPVFSNVVKSAQNAKQQAELSQAYSDYVQHVDAKQYDIVVDSDVYLVKISGESFTEAWHLDANREWKEIHESLTFAEYEQAEGLAADYETYNHYKVYVKVSA